MADRCYVTYRSGWEIINNQTTNVTEELVENVRQLFHIHSGTRIDLNFLQIATCFQQETCSIIFLILFFINELWLIIKKISKKFNEQLRNDYYWNKSSSSKNYIRKNSRNSSFEDENNISKSTIYFKFKKFVAAILVSIYLIEIGIVLVIHHFEIESCLTYLSSILLSLSASICAIYYLFRNRNEKFVSFFWLISIGNYLFNMAAYYILIDKQLSLWHICSTCSWNNLPSTGNHIDSKSINLLWLHFDFLYFIIFFIQFGLAFMPNFKYQHQNPECEATFFGRIFFLWINSTIHRGYRRPLQINDIFPASFSVETLETIFFNSWTKNFLRKKPRQKYSHHRNSFRLVMILVRQFGSEFFRISLIKLLPTLMTFLGPLILDRLIRFATTSDQPHWHGYAYVVAMFLLFNFESVMNSYSEYRLMVLALKIKASLTASIYHRLISSRLYSIDSNASGRIINIMSTDTQRIFEYIKTVNLFWICPLQITIAIWLLWQHLGYGSLAGLAVLLLLLPFNAFIGAQIRYLQTKLLEHKDRRIKSLNETLSGIRAIKLYAWEEFFIKRIADSRMSEVSNLVIQALYSAAITFAFTSAPFFVAFASFSMFLFINSNSVHLDANKAFVSLAIFNIIRRPLAFFPQLITNSMMFLVSLKRISHFLEPNPDQPRLPNHSSINSETGIKIQKCNFAWSAENNFTLSNIDLNLHHPELWAIVGGIGSGKSSLMSAILGQMMIQNEFPVCEINGSIAYVPQNSWIQTGTIRENILFGRPFDPVRYWRTMDTCCLLDDLNQMAIGDKTMVGEKGFNLSGGQRQRISLARAVYADADIYLLDDPLSALDPQVSKKIFKRVIGNSGVLAGKIRLLVTHNMALLPHADNILLMKCGTIVNRGRYTELISQENDFTEFLTTYFSINTTKDDSPEKEIDSQEQELLVEEEDYEILVEMAERLEKQFSSFSRSGSILRKISLSRDDIRKKHQTKNNKKKTKNSDKDSHADFTESIRTGSISYKIYWRYIQAIGIVPLILIIIFYSVGHGFVVLNNLWLSSWSNDATTKNHTGQSMSDQLINNLLEQVKLKEPGENIDQWFRLNVYAVLGVGQTIFILIATLLLNFACLRGSQTLHRSMLDRIMHAPIWFFDHSTSGQILNRFNKDIDLADTTLISTLRLFMIEIFRTIASFSIISVGTSSPVIICFFLPLIIAYFLIYKYYVSTSRQLMRLESTLRTPIYLQFNETLVGIPIIQTFGMVGHFLKRIYQRIEVNTSAYHMSIGSSRWLSIRLEFLGNIVVLITALTCVILRGQITPGMVGLCITCALTITATLNLLIRSSIELENSIVTVERLVEYTRLPQEDQWHRCASQTVSGKNSKRNFFSCIKNLLTGRKSNVDLPILCSSRRESRWMRNGSISFCQYSARYQGSIKWCLRNINLFVPAGTKVGIVGRTGAGKSSLAMALFRLIEADMGCVSISERNLKELGLHELRSALTIIPQDPLLFTGTIRENLDPYRHYDEHEILQAIAKSHLTDIVCSISQLNQSMDNLLNSLSFGQKQLFCLARAMLRRSKVLILDEATAGIDPVTDILVQETIRQEFSDCTVLTIAHRLKTVLNYDRILVLDGGQVAEYDTPEKLSTNQSSLFYQMISACE